MKFSECLKMYRLRANLTQSELAYKIGVSPATVSKYEVGSVSPDINMLTNISRVFNVSTDKLLGLSTDDSSNNTYTISYTQDELELLELFKQLPEKYKYEIKGYIKGIILSTK